MEESSCGGETRAREQRRVWRRSPTRLLFEGDIEGTHAEGVQGEVKHMIGKFRERNREKRKAVVVVQAAVCMTVLMGFAAITVDVGMLYRSRAELQAAADSAALAAASSLTEDDMLALRLGGNGASSVLSQMVARAQEYSLLNETLGSPTAVGSSAISTGWIDVTSATSPIDTTVSTANSNAIHVYLEKSGTTNGAVEFFFAPIMGMNSAETSASAVAAMDDRFMGFDTSQGSGYLMPLTISLNVYNAEMAGGSDAYDYDESSGSIGTSSDGIPELNLYPYVNAPGNFGLLNIGTPNQSTPGLANQIENGVDPGDLQTEIGTTELLFSQDDGSSVTYNITGNPGMKAALESAFETREGEVIAFLIHDQVTGNGANTTYRISDIKFGRLMDVKLQGAAGSRGIWIQPAAFAGEGVRVGPGGPSTGGMLGRMMLVR